MKQRDLLTQCPSVEIFQRINLKLIDAESDVAPCRHADPLMNRSALHYCILVVPGSVCLPVFLNANCLCNIPSFRQLWVSVLRLARSSFFLWHYKNPYCTAILLLRYRTFICLLCQPDWTAANSWIMSPRRHINSVKFQGCLYLFKSKVSLKRRQKVQMWDRLDCFDKFGSWAFRQLTPLYSPLSVLNLFCYWWAVCSAVHTVLSGFSNRVQ